MASNTKTCTKCQKQFLIIDQEQAFLRQKGLLAPVFCPACRQDRRLALRGVRRKLYKAACQKCGEQIITSYDPSTVHTAPIFCNKDYWDFWATTDITIKEPLPELSAEAFFTELERILNLLPKPPLRMDFSEDCEMADCIYKSKNVNRSFDCFSCTNSIYLYDSYLAENCVDCDYAVESQLCYESVDPFKAFNCDFVEYCDNIRDSAFCYYCSNCHDVFGCVGLKNKSFCIFNRQLTEPEYRERVEKYRKLPAAKILQMIEELKQKFPRTQTIGGNNENADFGNYIHYNKNCYLCFDAGHDEDCAYLYDTFYCKSCYDMSYSGQEDSLCYENYYTSTCFNCDYSVYSDKSTDCSYLINSTNAKNCFGCVGVDNKQYFILNRQLTSEEYEKIKAQLLADIIQKNFGWGNIVF